MTYFTRMGFPKEQVSKDSAASTKAWLSRQRSHKLGPDGTVSLSKYAAKFDRKDITVRDIMAHFSESDQREVEQKVAEAKGQRHTVDEFSDGKGNYTAARQMMHQKIIDDILTPEAIARATPREGEAPNFVVLGGRGGSGKSKFTDGTISEFDASKHVVLDSDVVKQSLIPPYSGWNAAAVHEESSHVFDLLHDKAKSLGLNIVHDVTLRSGSIVSDVDDLRARGYTVEGHYMHLSRENAAGRAVQRYLGKGPGKRGRLVPPEVVLTNVNNEKNFDDLKSKFDKWSAYDNSGPSGSMPRLIAKGGRS